MRKLDKNPEITEKAAKYGIYYWQIGEFLEMADTTFSRMMRHKLDEPTNTKVLHAIEELAKELRSIHA